MADIDKEKAQTNPAAVFDKPADVAASKELQPGEKAKILQEWELDARLQEVAAEEGMARKPVEPDKQAPVVGKVPAERSAAPQSKPAAAKPLEPIHEVRKEALASLNAPQAAPARPAAPAPAAGAGGRKIAIAAGIGVVLLVGVALAASTMMRSRHAPEPSQAAAPATPQPPTVVQVSNPPPGAATPSAANAAVSPPAPPSTVNAAAVSAPSVNAPAPKRKAVSKPKDDIPF